MCVHFTDVETGSLLHGRIMEVKSDMRLRVSIVKICNVILRNGKMRRSKYLAVIACVRLQNIYIVMKPQIIKRQMNIPIFKRLL